MAITKQDALDYHTLDGRPGKIEVIPTKSHSTQRDLSLAYSPGVADPCLAIQDNPEDAYKYTAKGNLVAVITNGSAVLGLGNIGPLAGKPVMEGKGVLFKQFADIDVFDIELDERDPKKVIDIVRALSPTFGGVNLEDIKAPECFHIEEALKEKLETETPVFFDELAQRGEQEKGHFKSMFKDALKEAINELGLATRDDLEKLKKDLGK